MTKQLLTNPATGEIVDSPAQIIQIWSQATEMKKQAEKSLDFCKAALVSINVPINKPLWNGVGLVEVRRENMEYNISKLKAVIPEDVLEQFLTVKKTAFREWLGEKGADHKEATDQCLGKGEDTTFFQLKKLI